MIDPDLHGRALHCAMGPKQRLLVKELLTLEKVPVNKDLGAYRPYWMSPLGYPNVYGNVRLPADSFVNLRKRLNAAGFRFHKEPEPEDAQWNTTRYIRMVY